MTIANANFLLASNESRVGTVRYSGSVVISPDAIYVFQEMLARGRDYMAVAELMADCILPVRQLVGAPYSTIPEPVRSHPDWPVRNSDASCLVLVIPQTAVDFLHHKKGKLEVRLLYSGTDIAIYHGRFGGGKIRSFIQTTGWPAFWDKELINADETLAIRQLANESAKRLRAPTLSYWIIGAGFLIDILLIYPLALGRFDSGPLSNVIFVCWIVLVLLILLGWVALRRGF